MKNMHPTVLIILDGFGYSNKTSFNAIYHAHTPNIDQWLTDYPNAILKASGMTVGLLDEYIGNSEVGHLTIGSGRVIPQMVSIMHKAIDDGSFFHNKVLIDNLKKLKKIDGSLHIMGLLSDAGVHSHEKHLHAFLQSARQAGINNIIVHPFLDGRDVAPQSAFTYLQRLDEALKGAKNSTIGSIHGRFYAMDRDKNWERTEQSYRILTEKQKKITYKTWQAALDAYYKQGITDEFIPPTQLNSATVIQPNDGIIFFNFRPDRARQLTESFLESSFSAFSTNDISLTCFVTPIMYNEHLQTDALFHQSSVINTLKEILSKAGRTILSIAETEKYAHVTYFFGGGKEEPFAHEERILIPSIPAKNYIDCPQMSAHGITKAVLQSLKTDPKDFYLINYANADMVGHSGDFDATVEAIEYLDAELKKIYDIVVEQMEGTLYVTADHGNAEDMFDETTQQPKTAHTTNPVPFIMIKKGLEHSDLTLPIDELADIAPFILQQMELPILQEMKNQKKVI